MRQGGLLALRDIGPFSRPVMPSRRFGRGGRRLSGCARPGALSGRPPRFRAASFELRQSIRGEKMSDEVRISTEELHKLGTKFEISADDLGRQLTAFRR